MTFEELQLEWNAMEVPARSHDDLLGMTRASHLPRLRKMRMRLIGECGFSVLFVTAVIVVSDLFSGPLWLSVAFIACNILFLFNDFLGYGYLQILPQRISLQLSLLKFTERMKRLVVLSRIASVSMGLVAILILIVRVRVGADNIILWAIMVPLLIGVTWLSSRNWSRRIREVKRMLRDLNE